MIPTQRSVIARLRYRNLDAGWSEDSLCKATKIRVFPIQKCSKGEKDIYCRKKDQLPVPFGATTRIAPPVPILNMVVINTLFILQVRLTTSNTISLVKLLMVSIGFNVACVIYNILDKLNVPLKTVLMNTDDLYSTLLVITSILQFQNTFLPVIIPIIICFDSSWKT